MSAYATRKNLRTLRMCLEDAVRLGMIPKNPAKAVRGPKVEPKPILVWTGEEAERALEQARREAHRLHAFLHLNLTTGLRREEMLGLRWQDVDLERGSLKVVQACTYLSGRPRFDRPKSRAGRRTISLDEGTAAVMRSWRSRLALERAGQERRGRWTDLDLVFPSTVGTPFSEPALGPALRGIMARAGVPRIRAYDLRHSYASLAYEAGVPIKLIGERMGHANVAFTLQTYVHSNEQQRRAAALGTVELFGSRVRAERASAVILPSTPVEPN